MAGEMFTVELRGLDSTLAHIGSLPAELRASLVRTTRVLMAMLERKVKGEHLSGPTGTHSLSVRTGNLRASVFQLPVTQTETMVSGGVGYGADVAYAAIHEFGGTIHHPGGTAYYIDEVTLMAKFVSNKSAVAGILPRTKPHDIKMPARAPLRTSLQEMEQTIRDAYRMAATEVLK